MLGVWWNMKTRWCMTIGQNNLPWRVANISTTISKYFTMAPSVLIPLVGGMGVPYTVTPMVQGNKLQGGNFILRFHPKPSGIAGLFFFFLHCFHLINMGLALIFNLCESLYIGTSTLWNDKASLILTFQKFRSWL